MCSDSLAWKMPNVSMPGAARSMLLIVNLALLPTLTSLQAWPGWKTGCPTCGQKPKNAIEQQLHVVGVLRFFVLFVFRQLPKVYLSCHCATWSVLPPCAARLMPGYLHASRAFLTYPAMQQRSLSVPNGKHILIPGTVLTLEEPFSNTL